MPEFTTKPLSPKTWPDFASLVESNNGVWGGCWCLSFHAEGAERGPQRKRMKECRVREGNAHAALVYHGKACVGWCQFGSPSELPRIKHQRAYKEGLEEAPDWRITCFFVDKAYRGKGVTSVALQGALKEIARLGGGKVESYPEDLTGRKVSSSFLYNGSMGTFERNGFKKLRPLGKNHWVVGAVVKAPRRRPE
ncbi:MAG TPA: GNAT family N-acetyltransferase [Opitutaceae bacterium]|jgi:GNAT superfamily N-acetyltransferase|nr:GNAT family N-acetyltransferase [Opitutaceae bacterium]